jgi:hypothetical protein
MTRDSGEEGRKEKKQKNKEGSYTIVSKICI